MLHQDFFYVSPECVKKNSLRFTGEEYKHLVHVLRKKVGQSAYATDGLGNSYLFQLSDITETYAEATIVNRRRRAGESLFQLTLALSILKGKRFELVIEKGTEIGITRFIPLITERTIVEKNTRKLNRWQHIALAAMKQSCRSILPEITAPLPFEKLFSASLHYELKLVAHNSKDVRSMTQIFSKHYASPSNSYFKSGIILIGPEGGFTNNEIELAQQYHFFPLLLGPRRLRSETASIVASTLLMEKVGDL